MVAPLAGGGDVHVRPVEGPRGRLRDRHASAVRIRCAAHRALLLLHPHRLRGPVPADARQGRVLSDGLGRQRAAHRAARAVPLQRPLRPGAPVRSDVPPGRRAADDLAAQLHRTVRTVDGRRREGLRAAVASARAVGRLGLPVHDDRADRPAGQPAGVPAEPGARRGLPGRGADAVGRHVLHRRGPGRAGGPRAARGVPPAPLRSGARGRHHPARAVAGVRGARLPPVRQPLRRTGRRDRPDPTVRCGGPGAGPPAGRTGQRYGHRHGLHVR